MKQLTLTIIALLGAVPAFAKEPSGCDKFKWPLERERAMLATPTAVTSSGTIAQPLSTAFKLTLAPYNPANMPIKPTRTPKDDSNAGFINVPALPKAGTYRITLSQPAWIDVIQNGHAVKPNQFTGATGCKGLRKSVKFDLTASPFMIELTGTAMNSITFVVTPD
jgi:hypothetical protein